MMVSSAEKRKKLKALVDAPGIVTAPGCGDALGAVLIEEAGFEAVFMSGYAVEATYARPDVGLLTLPEMAARVAQICDVTSIPLIADADTGYGNVVNVNRMVREWERAGAAAIQLEDQVLPKKCGSMKGKGVVSVAEMVGKIKAAIDARTDYNFQIIARTDIAALEGMNAVSDRLAAYREAGADLLMALGPYSVDDVRAFIGKERGRVAYLNSESFTMPMLPTDELEAMGAKVVILPLSLTMSSIYAMRQTLKVIRENKATTHEHAAQAMATWADCNRLTGIDEIQRLENTFGPDAARRAP
jgi:2-methylisocitrate lyase-like PEP mutase family enzyme